MLYEKENPLEELYVKYIGAVANKYTFVQKKAIEKS